MKRRAGNEGAICLDLDITAITFAKRFRSNPAAMKGTRTPASLMWTVWALPQPCPSESCYAGGRRVSIVPDNG